jgi:hypothetical protein
VVGVTFVAPARGQADATALLVIDVHIHAVRVLLAQDTLFPASCLEQDLRVGFSEETVKEAWKGLIREFHLHPLHPAEQGQVWCTRNTCPFHG